VTGLAAGDLLPHRQSVPELARQNSLRIARRRLALLILVIFQIDLADSCVIT
jgi:hypothetical protein